MGRLGPSDWFGPFDRSLPVVVRFERFDLFERFDHFDSFDQSLPRSRSFDQSLPLITGSARSTTCLDPLFSELERPCLTVLTVLTILTV